jgi:hypothetical protein
MSLFFNVCKLLLMICDYFLWFISWVSPHCTTIIICVAPLVVVLVLDLNGIGVGSWVHQPPRCLSENCLLGASFYGEIQSLKYASIVICCLASKYASSSTFLLSTFLVLTTTFVDTKNIVILNSFFFIVWWPMKICKNHSTLVLSWTQSVLKSSTVQCMQFLLVVCLIICLWLFQSAESLL